MSFDRQTPIEVLVVNFGYALRINGRRIGAECGNGPQEGMAVPRTDGRLEPLGLTSCLSRWLPSASDPRACILANPGRPLSDMVMTAQSVLAAGASVVFGAPR